MRVVRGEQVQLPMCLNPCFNGTYSMRETPETNEFTAKVLILVLMEHTL